MTSLDYKDIQTLHFVHRFIPATIARLYGVSHVVILRIIDKSTYSLTDTECLICGLEEEIFPFYIDGNEDNNSPQNVLMLCENHKRKFSHLKSRRKIRLQS